MKNYLSKVAILGLWGNDKPVEFSLDRAFNFLIGRNGTGKTTVINLLAAALTADFERLDKIHFSKIYITLATAGSRRRPSIEVIKKQKPNLPYFDITYKIKSGANEEAVIYDLDALEDERVLRGVPQKMLRERYYRERYLYIQRQLESMVSVNWLSVHRNSEVERAPDERKFVSAIDAKLSNMNNLLVRYFSKLTTSFAEETKNFQQTSFLSLTSIQKEANIRSFVELIDVEAEKKSLASVFELLGVEQRRYERQVDQMMQELSMAKQPYVSGEPISMRQLFSILNSFKAHALVQHYESLQMKKKDVFAPVDRFLMVMNSLLAPRKQVSISSQNELIIKNLAGTRIDVEDLSSGEKQLLIILGHALLQDSAHYVYIADEPELSLHVDWQEKLTLAISQLNPNAQIVFATHSPDIVGAHSDRILDMEALAA